MIVEFLGLPGSGKTTLIRALGTRLLEEGWNNLNVLTLDKIDRRLARPLKIHPIARHSYRIDSIRRLYPDFIGAVDRVFDESPVHKAFVFDALVRYDIAKGTSDQIGLMLIDEGAWYRLLVAAVYKMLEPSELFDQIGNFPMPDAVVIFDCSIEQSVKNLINRLKSGGFTPDQIKSKIKALGANDETIVRNRLSHIQHISDQFENRGVKIIRLKANSALDGMVDTVHHTLGLSARHKELVWYRDHLGHPQRASSDQRSFEAFNPEYRRTHRG